MQTCFCLRPISEGIFRAFDFDKLPRCNGEFRASQDREVLFGESFLPSVQYSKVPPNLLHSIVLSVSDLRVLNSRWQEVESTKRLKTISATFVFIGNMEYGTITLVIGLQRAQLNIATPLPGNIILPTVSPYLLLHYTRGAHRFLKLFALFVSLYLYQSRQMTLIQSSEKVS